MLPVATEALCLECHGGVAPSMRPFLSEDAQRKLRNLRPELEAPYGHALGTASLHRRGETLPETDPGVARHVTCLDCHDAHRPLDLSPRLDGAATPAPSTLRGATYLYEVCLRCHGDSANLPAGSRNIRSLLQPGNRSTHPVLGPRRQSEVPSLRKPWSEGGRLSCLDCHGSGDGRPGAHGSRNPGMLREPYLHADRVPESEITYRLCYRCHERRSILGDESFSLHSLHLTRPEAQTSCATCHDAHGSRQNDHLIEFDPMVVSPTRAGEVAYESAGLRTGTCRLTCHGVEHAPARYCPTGSACDPGVVQKVGDATGTQRNPLRGAPPWSGLRPGGSP
jgi:hypothetical protein